MREEENSTKKVLRNFPFRNTSLTISVEPDQTHYQIRLKQHNIETPWVISVSQDDWFMLIIKNTDQKIIFIILFGDNNIYNLMH